METFTGIWSLDPTSPAETDDINQGDDQIRGIKSTIKTTFPNISGTAAVSAAELNHLVGTATNIDDHFETISASLSTVISRVAELSASLGTKMGFASMYLLGSTTEFSASTSLSLFTGFTTAGLTDGMSVSTASGVVVVAKTGLYEGLATLCVSASTAATLTIAIYVDDAATNGQSSTRIPAQGRNSITVSADFSASATEEVQVRLSTVASTLITVKDAQFRVKRIG